jgi:hypothetical protein
MFRYNCVVYMHLIMCLRVFNGCTLHSTCNTSPGENITIEGRSIHFSGEKQSLLKLLERVTARCEHMESEIVSNPMRTMAVHDREYQQKCRDITKLEYERDEALRERDEARQALANESTAVELRHCKLANEYEAELDALRSARREDEVAWNAIIGGIEGRS